MGEGAGRGYSVNIPLLPGTGDLAYEHVLDSIFVPLAEEFRPQVIMMVDGSDTHFTDRITQMGLTLKGIYMIANKVRGTAERVCQGRVAHLRRTGYSRTPANTASLPSLAASKGVPGSAATI